jgi:hypothetical protein
MPLCSKCFNELVAREGDICAWCQQLRRNLMIPIVTGAAAVTLGTIAGSLADSQIVSFVTAFVVFAPAALLDLDYVTYRKVGGLHFVGCRTFGFSFYRRSRH